MADDHDLTDDELLALPGNDIPPGRLSDFFTRRAAVAWQRNLDERMLELSGNSRRHLMIFDDQDPRAKHREEERRRQDYEQGLREITRREDRLLAQIEDQQRLVEKRLKEIDDRAIKLHDGRRAYVNGDGYTDGQGRALTGADDAEARAERAKNPNAATAQEHADAESKRDELKTLKQDVQQHREDRDQAGTAPDLKQEQETVSGFKQRFQHATQTSAQDIEARSGGVADAYGADSLASGRTTSYAKQQDGGGQILAANFTPAAAGQGGPAEDKTPRPSAAPDITPT
jgi:hypothetical protein